MLREFERRHPDADVRIVLEATPDPIPALQRGELELAIVAADVSDRDLAVASLFEDEVVAIVAPGHRLATQRFLRGADLAGETLLAFGTTGPDAAWFRRAFLGRTLPGALRAVPITEVLIELVKAETGIGIVHRWIAEPQIRSGAVVACRLTRTGLRKTWKAVHAQHAPRREALADLIALIRGAARAPGQRRVAAPARALVAARRA